MPMHADQLDVPVATVRRLVDGQFPQWAALPVRPLASSGTVNALFRIGDDLVARLPRHEDAVPLIRNELRWLREAAAGLPVVMFARIGDRVDDPWFTALAETTLGRACPDGLSWSAGRPRPPASSP